MAPGHEANGEDFFDLLDNNGMWVYSLESPRCGDSNEYKHQTIAWWNMKIFLNICFLELSEEDRRD